MAEAAEKKAETAEKKADERKAEEVKADDKPDASAAAAVIEEDLFEDFPFGEGEPVAVCLAASLAASGHRADRPTP